MPFAGLSASAPGFRALALVQHMERGRTGAEPLPWICHSELSICYGLCFSSFYIT